MSKHHQKTFAYLAMSRRYGELSRLEYAITQPMSDEERLELKEEIEYIKQKITMLKSLAR